MFRRNCNFPIRYICGNHYPIDLLRYKHINSKIIRHQSRYRPLSKLQTQNVNNKFKSINCIDENIIRKIIANELEKLKITEKSDNKKSDIKQSDVTQLDIKNTKQSFDEKTINKIVSNELEKLKIAEQSDIKHTKQNLDENIIKKNVTYEPKKINEKDSGLQALISLGCTFVFLTIFFGPQGILILCFWIIVLLIFK